MKNKILTFTRKELSAYFTSPVAFVFMGTFLLALIIALLWWGPRIYLRYFAPDPPRPEVVAAFTGGEITKNELLEVFHQYLPEDFDHSGLNSLPVYQNIIKALVMDKIIKEKAREKKMDKRKNIKHLMKHVTEEIGLNDLHTGFHEGKLKPDEIELQKFYENNIDRFGEASFSDVREQVEAAVIGEKEQGFIEKYIEGLKAKAVITKNYELLNPPPPGDYEMRDYYEVHRDQFIIPAKVRVKIIEMKKGKEPEKNREKMNEALLKIRSGEDFDAVSGAGGFSTIKKGERGKIFDDAVFGLFPGEVSGLIETETRLSIVKMVEKIPERLSPFEDVRNEIAREIMDMDKYYEDNKESTLFTIHGEPYTLGDFYTEFKELPPSRQGEYESFEMKKKLLDQLIVRSLLVEESSDQLSETKNREELEHIRGELLREIYHQEEVDDKITITDGDAANFYRKNREHFREPPKVKISMIRVDGGYTGREQKEARKKIEEAAAQLKPGVFSRLKTEQFSSVAKKYSDDIETREKGGQLDEWITESEDILSELVSHHFHEQVLKLKKGEISDIIELGGSFWIVLAREREEGGMKPLREVMDHVKMEVRKQKHNELTEELATRLLREANFTVYDKSLFALIREDRHDSIKQESITGRSRKDE